ncbi:ANTAR domain-containing protein (plasmid) [Rhodococcus sp. ZPP]|uniref:PAS and ANTAR domain-containing protein n=1 Tax=Rhodococcus TaxID=1827 RepID=UPI0009E7EA17|nr:MULTISPECIES: PAS and ANTAR domain-containing protein [Rhodococcus]QTJ71102.1 ANTAR domain-containing protein [Rhodococcus sp. ZPP]
MREELDVRVDRAVDQIFGSGVPHRVGSFRFYLDGERWEWSDAVAHMHGYRPGEVTPTTALVLSHKHPEDEPRVAAVLEKMISEKEPFGSEHRIIDTGGRLHQVIVVGDRMLDAGGKMIGTSGFYIDVTDSHDTEVQASVDEIVDELEKSRAVIEQAKGVLMVAYGISAERAFDVLTWRSQQTNIKVRTIAAHLVRDLAADAETPVAFRRRVERVLFTVHERIPGR